VREIVLLILTKSNYPGDWRQITTPACFSLLLRHTGTTWIRIHSYNIGAQSRPAGLETSACLVPVGNFFIMPPFHPSWKSKMSPPLHTSRVLSLIPRVCMPASTIADIRNKHAIEYLKTSLYHCIFNHSVSYSIKCNSAAHIDSCSWTAVSLYPVSVSKLDLSTCSLFRC